MNPIHLRAGRGILNWSVRELSVRSGVSTATINRAEAGTGRLLPDTSDALRIAMEKAGVEFIEENGGGAGVRMRRRSKPVKPD